MNDEEYINRQIRERERRTIEARRQESKVRCQQVGHGEVIVGKGPGTPIRCNACGARAVWEPAP